MILIKKMSEAIDKIIRIMIQILTGLMFIVILAQVIFRYFLANPLPWSEELAKICMNWITFLGACVACKANSLSRVDIVTHNLSPKVQKILLIVTDIIMLVLTVLLFIYGLQLIMTPSAQNGVSTALHIPFWLIYLCLPLGFALLIFQLLCRLIITIFDNTGKGGEKE